MTKANENEGEEIIVTNKKMCCSGIDGRIFLGLVLIFLGGLFLLQNYFDVEIWEAFWPIMLILIGIFLIIKKR